MKLRLTLITALFCSVSVGARAASFDCTKAQRPVEKAICSNGKLSAADEQIALIYRNALGKLSSSTVGVLRTDQVQWLAWAQQVCRAGLSRKEAASFATCLLPLYEQRILRLRISVVRRDGIGFLTRTQYLATPEKDAPELGTSTYPGFGTLQASWPMADSTDQEWTAWNKAMEAQAFAMAGRGIEDVTDKPLTTDPVWNAELAEEQDTQVIAQVKSLEHNRITVSLNTSAMGHGAAHPNEVFATLTWLLDGERLLRSDDVFAAGSNWKQRLATACWKALSTGEQKAYLYAEVKGPDAPALQSVLSDTRNWTVEADGLHISYPEYSVAPRVSPVDDTVIPWTDLKPVLAADFATP